MSYDGACAIVTGAGSGIGRACARRLASDGLAIAAVDANEEAAKATVDELTKDGHRAAAFGVDVTDEDAVAAMVPQAAELGAPRVLVNAAGIIVRKKLLESTLDEWRRVLDVNLTGYFVMLKNVIPAMAAAGGGSIVQIASIAGHIGYGFTSYTAAKGGVLAMTKQLAGELAADNIRINSVSPGVVHTGINRDTLSTQVIHDATVSATPLGRIGQPEDIASVVAFLASENAGYVTGADLVADGGMISQVNWGDAGERLHSYHSQEQR